MKAGRSQIDQYSYADSLLALQRVIKCIWYKKMHIEVCVPPQAELELLDPL